MSNFQIRKSDLNSFQFIFNVIKHEVECSLKALPRLHHVPSCHIPFLSKSCLSLSQDSIHGVLQLGGIPKIIKLSVYCLIKNKSIKHRFCCFWKCVIFCLCCAHSAVKSRISLIFENLIPNNPSYIPCLVSTWIICYTGRFDGVL